MTIQNEKRLKQFGRHLQKLREQKNLSLRELASLASMDFSQIHRIEKGKTNPGLTILLNLAESLDVSCSELMNF
jgi:transcriptional regulator with XRE-family HTH domain